MLDRRVVIRVLVSVLIGILSASQLVALLSAVDSAKVGQELLNLGEALPQLPMLKPFRTCPQPEYHSLPAPLFRISSPEEERAVMAMQGNHPPDSDLMRVNQGGLGRSQGLLGRLPRRGHPVVDQVEKRPMQVACGARPEVHMEECCQDHRHDPWWAARLVQSRARLARWLMHQSLVRWPLLMPAVAKLTSCSPPMDKVPVDQVPATLVAPRRFASLLRTVWEV